ncbi:MAG: helix-turn-helix domain-containing protein, partial [Microcystaceae cyanobacterium]
GSKHHKILERGHETLSTYGIGQDHSTEEWKNLGRSLIRQGLLAQSDDGYSVLRLNELSWEVMKSQRKVEIRVIKKVEKVDKNFNFAAEVEHLYDQLRRCRKQLADQQSIPPYMIFGDSTLRLMAQQNPQTLEEMKRVSGVGDYKLQRYGQAFLTVLKSEAKDSDRLSPTHSETRSTQPSSAKFSTLSPTNPGESLLETLTLYQQGLDLTQIANHRQLKTTTITEHFVKLIEISRITELENLVNLEHQQEIAKAIAALGDERLTPIYEHFNGKYSYDEIKFVRAYLRQKKRNIDW